eukprot:747219-Hanusia_phi.AAC.11
MSLARKVSDCISKQSDFCANNSHSGESAYVTARMFENKEESRIVAEAWKILDKAFVDKTFNGNDWAEVRKKYVRTNYKNTAEAYAAIREMTALLGDRFTRFLTPAQYDTLSKYEYSNSYEVLSPDPPLVSMYTSETPQAGVGVEMALDPESNQIKIVSVVPSSPAERVGVKKGDYIVAVNDVAVGGKERQSVEQLGSTPDDVASLLRGDDGSSVKLKLEARGKTRDVELSREILKATSVSSKLVPSPESSSFMIGVIRVPSFNKATTSQVGHERNAIGEGSPNTGSQGVQDLRDAWEDETLPCRPSSWTSEGILELLPSDTTIVSVADGKGSGSDYRTEHNGALAEVSLAVLVDHNTASAAEVLTAALQDNKRAGIIGEKTYGKGLVQTIARLQDGSALVITVAKYRTPLGQDINKVLIFHLLPGSHSFMVGGDQPRSYGQVPSEGQEGGGFICAFVHVLEYSSRLAVLVNFHTSCHKASFRLVRVCETISPVDLVVVQSFANKAPNLAFVLLTAVDLQGLSKRVGGSISLTRVGYSKTGVILTASYVAKVRVIWDGEGICARGVRRGDPRRAPK